MVDHRHTERVTHHCLVFDEEQFDESGHYVGNDPLGEVDVAVNSGGDGWVQADTGQFVSQSPTLDWPVGDEHLAKEGRELHLRPFGSDAPTDPVSEYVIENRHETYGRYRSLEYLSVSITTVQ